MSRKANRVIDTNVPMNANRAIDPMAIPNDELSCVMACVDAIAKVVARGGLVIDAGDEIYNEYRANLSLSGKPAQGDKFMKWVHDNRWGFPEEDRVAITIEGNTYQEFPTHPGLKAFDNSDRKFVAVANSHRSKPPILEATDSKWWGWKDVLNEVGITVEFLCESWIQQKYLQKMGS